jgi:hypothetical protein
LKENNSIVFINEKKINKKVFSRVIEKKFKWKTFDAKKSIRLKKKKKILSPKFDGFKKHYLSMISIIFE